MGRATPVRMRATRFVARTFDPWAFARVFQTGQRVELHRLSKSQRARALAGEAAIHQHGAKTDPHQPAELDTRSRAQPTHVTRPATMCHQCIPAIRALAPRRFKGLDRDRLVVIEQSGLQPVELLGAWLAVNAYRELYSQLRELAHQGLREITITGEQFETTVVRRQWTDRYPASSGASRQPVEKLTGIGRVARREIATRRAVINDDARVGIRGAQPHRSAIERDLVAWS